MMVKLNSCHGLTVSTVWNDNKAWLIINHAGVAELADALDLGSSVLRRGGSSPFTRTCRLSSVGRASH